MSRQTTNAAMIARLLAWTLAIILLTVPWAVSAQESTSTALVVQAGETYSGDVATINQPIVINGVVEGDVTSVTGSIIVRGAVEGDVVSLFGDVTFESQAVANGNVMAAAGKVSMPASAQVAARGAVYNGSLEGRGLASVLPGTGSQPLDFTGRIILILTLATLALVVAALLSVLWPRSISGGAKAIMMVPGRAFGMGLTWLVLTVAVIGISTAILIFSLVGMAVVPVVLLIAQIPYLVGLAAAGQALGERLGLQQTAAVVAGSAVLLLPCVVVAAVSLPAAFGLFYALAGVGIGGMFLLRAAVLQRNSAQY